MEVQGKEYNIDELMQNINFEDNLLQKRDNCLLLSNKHIEILNRYELDYRKYNSISSLIFDIEDYLNFENSLDTEDLEWVSNDLSERNYYQNTKK